MHIVLETPENRDGVKHAQNSHLNARILAQIYFKYNGLKKSKS